MIEFLTLELILIAFGLSADAFAVSLTQGADLKPFRWKNTLLIAVFFGFFQFLMPCLGALAGKQLHQFISSWDHWVAFALLLGVGGKMLWEAFQGDEDEAHDTVATLKVRTLFILAVATSLDAMAVGLSFGLNPHIAVIPSAITIGIITFVCSLIGVILGYRGAKFLGSKAEIVGGLILIGIGVKILVEHLELLS